RWNAKTRCWYPPAMTRPSAFGMSAIRWRLAMERLLAALDRDQQTFHLGQDNSRSNRTFSWRTEVPRGFVESRHWLGTKESARQNRAALAQERDQAASGGALLSL